MVTVKDAAGMLGVSAATLRNWDKSGQLRARRHPINKYRIYPLQEVLDLQKTLTLWPTNAEEVPPAVASAGRLSRGELRRLVHSLHRGLRDNDGNSSLVERFDELAKLVVVKVECERSAELAAEANLAGGGTDRAIAERVRRAFDAIVSAQPELFPSRFRRLGLNDRAIAEAARMLGAVTLGAHGVDLKGLLFEEIVRDTFEKGDNQQFFTPTAIVEFMVDFVAEWIRGDIADPACGTGGFLIAAASRLRDARAQRQPVRLWGLEIDARLAWASGVNLHLHDAPAFTVSQLDGAGSLSPGIRDRVPPLDVILTNPPFGSDLTDTEALASLELGAGRKSRRRGVLFIEQCLNLLKPGGIVAVIIDDGVLNAPTNADTRAHVLSKADLFAVVSLPEVAFMPYASVKASVLFLQKHGGKRPRAMSSKGTYFAAAEQVGRKPSGDPLYRFNRVTRRLDLDSDLPEILRAWREQATDSQSAFWSQLPDARDAEFSRALHRLDQAFHHPSRARATRMLHSSPHPLHALGDLCYLRSETLIPAEQCADDEITYVGLANIESHTGVVSPTVVPGSTLKSSVKRFECGDVLFAKMRPELRKVARVPADVAEGFCSAECLVLVPKDKGQHVMLPELLTQLLRSDLVYGQLVHQVMGIGRPRLRPADVMAVRVPLPPLEEQQALLARLDQAEAASRALMQESERACAKAAQIRIDAVDAMTTHLLGGRQPS
jgi:tRNA1(Val) A37 N6-methylase TrmN6